MIKGRNVNIIDDADGNKIVLINDVVFKGKRNINWEEVKLYLKGYVGDFYQIQENAEKIYIGNELPEEYTESESRKALKGARLLVNYAENGKKYLYDILAIKKETSKPQQ